MSRLTLIEFVVATEKRAVGTRLRVDAMSATSFVDRLKVAVRVGQNPPPPPAPPPAPEPEPAEPADGDD